MLMIMYIHNIGNYDYGCRNSGTCQGL